MSHNVGVVRNGDGLRDALSDIAEISQGDIPLAASNWLLTAQFITAAALQRKESRGSQFRSDYPEAIKEWAHHSTLALDDVEAISERALNFEHHDNSNVVKVAFAQ